MLDTSMTLKEMIDAQPQQADWQQLQETSKGIMRLCLVATQKEEAYEFLRNMASVPFLQLCQDFFVDFLESVCYDFVGGTKENPTFVLLTEYEFNQDIAAIQALMEAIITAHAKEIEVIADLFPLVPSDLGRTLRVYTQQAKAVAGWIQ